jgi:hypothetical protein
MPRTIKFDRTKMHELRVAGKTLKEIAGSMKCSMGTVANVMRGIYGAREHVGRRPSFSHIRIVEMYKANPNMQAIATELKCSYGTVRNVIKKEGLPVAKRGRKAKEPVVTTVALVVEQVVTPVTETPTVVTAAEVTPVVEVTPAPVVDVKPAEPTS